MQPFAELVRLGVVTADRKTIDLISRVHSGKRGGREMTDYIEMLARKGEVAVVEHIGGKSSSSTPTPPGILTLEGGSKKSFSRESPDVQLSQPIPRKGAFFDGLPSPAMTLLFSGNVRTADKGIEALQIEI